MMYLIDFTGLEGLSDKILSRLSRKVHYSNNQYENHLSIGRDLIHKKWTKKLKIRQG